MIQWRLIHLVVFIMGENKPDLVLKKNTTASGVLDSLPVIWFVNSTVVFLRLLQAGFVYRFVSSCINKGA